MVKRSPTPREERLLIGTDQQYRWLDGIVRAVVIFNLADAMFTLWWIQAGLAVEANTLMRDLVEQGAMVFVLAKIALVSLGIVVLWRRRTHVLAVIAIFGAFLVYYLVLLYHLQFTSYLVFGRFGS
jgi:hypothetical protein